MQDHKQHRDDKSIDLLDKVPIFIESQQTQHVELNNDDLDYDRQLTRSKHEAHGGEDIHLATAIYGPIVQGRLLTHQSGGRHGDEEGLRW
jgi:hypothetical protein